MSAERAPPAHSTARAWCDARSSETPYLRDGSGAPTAAPVSAEYTRTNSSSDAVSSRRPSSEKVAEFTAAAASLCTAAGA